MSVLDKVRRWIDGDSAETVLENAARDAQVKPRSAAEGFIIKLARSVEEVMQQEMVPLPQGTTLIPTEYIIFLSEADDKEWQGVKRRGLEQGLHHVLAERAREISGKKKLETQSFAVELRIDGTLEKGEIRVQPGWDDGSGGEKTGVLPRLKVQQPSQIKAADAVTPNFQPDAIPATVNYAQQPPATFPSGNLQAHIPQADDAEEKTQVKKRLTELYRLEIWRGGVRQSVMPVYENRIGVGRGSKSKNVEVTLEGDPEISRRQATLIYDLDSRVYLINEGRNPAIVSNREIQTGERVAIQPGEPVGIGIYLLRIQMR